MRNQIVAGAVAALSLISAAQAGERMTLPLFGVSIVLPGGWDADIPEPKPIPAAAEDHDFQVQVEAVCKTEACKATQEVCTIKTYDEEMGLWDTFSNLMLFPTKASMDETTRVVLDWTSDGATVSRPLARETIGTATWFTIETDAAPGYKSVLHARAVLGGRFMWALCRTCATEDKDRFDTARAILASIAVDRR